MHSNYLFNDEIDPVIPDLLPEGSFLDELLNTDVPAPMIPNADIVALNYRFDQLFIDMNTLSLRIEVEKAKRQKLNAIFRKLKQDLLSPHPELIKLRQNFETLRSEQNSINYHVEAEIASNSVMTFRGLSRIHQILAIMLPQVPPSINPNPELNQLLQELARTLQQFRVEYTTSYV